MIIARRQTPQTVASAGVAAHAVTSAPAARPSSRVDRWCLTALGRAVAGVPQAFSMAMLLAPSLVGGLTGVGIWLLVDRLASGLFDREAPTPPRSRGRFVPDPLLVALPILGAWLVAWALPELASGIALSVISRGGTQSVLGPIPYTADEQAMVWSATRKANEVGALVAGIVGLVLLLRSEQVAALLARAKLGPAEENGAEEEAEGSAPTQDAAEREPRTGRGEQQQ